jgi:hypothetical protein
MGFSGFRYIGHFWNGCRDFTLQEKQNTGIWVEFWCSSLRGNERILFAMTFVDSKVLKFLVFVHVQKIGRFLLRLRARIKTTG